MNASPRPPMTLLLIGIAGLVLLGVWLLPGDEGRGSPDQRDDETLTVPEDVTVVGVEQGVVSGTAGLSVGLGSSNGELASASFRSSTETYGESRMPVGRRVVVGRWEVQVAAPDDGYTEFWIRDHDREAGEPVALRPPGGTRGYPPGFSVQLHQWDGETAQLTVAVRTDPDARTIEGWEEQDVELTAGSSAEVHGYRLTWHDRVDDELQVVLRGPDGGPVMEAR
jgi:hypothetical protein